MEPHARFLAALGSVNAALAVALGAFGAHALEGTLAAGRADTFATAAQYHFYHGLGLLAVAFAASHLPAVPLLRWSGRLMAAGIVLFCGSLYALALTGATALGAVAPLGGASFIAAWVLLAVAFGRR